MIAGSLKRRRDGELIIILNSFLCFIISLLIIYISNKLHKKQGLFWVREGYNYVGSIAFSIIAFIGISTILLILFISAYFQTYSNSTVNLLKDSGIFLALIIFFTGLLSQLLYKLLLNVINRHTLDGLYPLTSTDVKWLFVLSCSLLMIIYFKFGFTKEALTIVAIVIGKFVWFDINKSQKDTEKQDLKKSPLIYWIIISYILLISIYCVFFERIIIAPFIGIIPSWILCLVYFYKKEKNHNKSNVK